MERDPIGVLTSTKPVIDAAEFVTIDHERVHEVAQQLADAGEPAADWSPELHPPARNEAELANLVLVLDALNFCFWSMPDAPTPRWQITHDGRTWDGYWALAVALRRGVEAGMPLADAEFLAGIDIDTVQTLLAGDPGTQPIPLLHARQTNLNEVGKALLEKWDGQFLNAIKAADRHAAKLIPAVNLALPSFQDTALWRGSRVHFYKRTQILIADLYGAFEGEGPGRFHDLHTLTAFADYKVPQVLRRHGILRYTEPLADRIRRHALLDPGSPEELEIRAATIWGVEYLRQTLLDLGREMPAYAIDWALWQSGQQLPPDTEPYHRTLTIYY